MSQKNKKKITLSFDKRYFDFVIIFLAISMLIGLMVKLGIPVIISMAKGLVALVLIYQKLAPTNDLIMFFGGLVFLFIGFYFFNILFNLWIRCAELTTIKTEKFVRSFKK